MSFAARALVAFGLLAALSCRQKEKPIGQLVVSIQTDMALPQQIDNVRLQISIPGLTLTDREYFVGGPNETLLPATLTVLAGKDPSLPVTIRVLGGKRGVWRTFREVITTVPTDRTASVRMPIQWLCDGTAKVIPGLAADASKTMTFQSTCGDGSSCVAGRCVPSPVPVAMLLDYQPQQVFGGAAEPGKGTCFDTVPCMLPGQLVDPIDADCTIPRMDDTARLNVALRVPNDGICDGSGTNCFIPLDAMSAEGWTVSAASDRLQLPRAACDKLRRGAISGIYVSRACAAKTEEIPTCGPWSSVRGGRVLPTILDAGAPPSAEQFASLAGDGSMGVPCCPLMNDGRKLYTCLCATKSTARVFSIDLATHEAAPVIDLPVPASRSNPYFAAALQDNTLFWVDAVANSLLRAPLPGDPRRYAPLPIMGEITEATPLLVDATSMYLQASAVTGAAGSPVQLLAIDRVANTVRAIDTRSNFHVHQFAQDATSLYLASDVDSDVGADGGAGPDAGAGIGRSSRVVRIAKSTGALTEISPVLTLTTPDKLRGGYIAVHTGLEGGGVYALSEGAPAPSGTVLTRVVKLDPTARTESILLERDLDPKTSGLWILGIVDGTVLLARTETSTGDGGPATVRNSSLIALPARGGSPRIVADFRGDYPLLGLDAVAADSAYVYWLNTSGQIWRVARTSLP